MTAPSRDLVFSQARLTGSPTPLVFGGDEFVIPAVTVDIYVTLAGSVEVTAAVSQPIKADAVVLLEGEVFVTALAAVPVHADALVLLAGSVSVSAAGIYDNRVTPWLDQRAAAPHQAASAGFTERGSAWGVSLPRREAAEQPWQSARQAGNDAALPHDSSLPRRQRADAPWQRAAQSLAQSAVPHQKGVPQYDPRAAPHQTATQTGAQSASGMQIGIFNAVHYASTWQWAQAKVRDLTGRSGASARLRGVQGMAHPWQMAGQAKNGKSVWPPIAPPGPTVYPRDGHLLFECPRLTGSPTYLVFGAQACYLPPVNADTVVVPVRKVYLVINDASLRRVDGNIQLPTLSMSLSLDVDSWTWSFGAALPGSTLPDLEPASSGAPVEVEALINGVAYRALVESIGRTREFGKSDIRVQGRGKTALLDSPYAPVQTFGNTGARTAQQIMGDVLTLNGVPLDWTVDWGLTDWLVPPGVFSHQGSYISALNTLAAAAGGYLQPHASLQTIRVLPRYAAAPWAWDAVAPDFDLPSDVTTREGIEWVERARYNRVFVSGQQSGVLGQVTRAGTAGDLLAPMVTDALVTHADAARQRGIAILANTGRQATVSLRLPVLAETGVITPGKFVRYTDAGVVRKGVVRSTGIEVGMPEIWQTIGVETHA